MLWFLLLYLLCFYSRFLLCGDLEAYIRQLTGYRCSSLVEVMLSTHEALGAIPSTRKMNLVTFYFKLITSQL
jgi:hypothetical protein